jgi:23S rRNA pseudouridine2605 synthase
MRIIRIRIDSLQLGNLKPKQWRHLTPDEVSKLKGETGSQSGRKKTARQKTI